MYSDMAADFNASEEDECIDNEYMEKSNHKEHQSFSSANHGVQVGDLKQLKIKV